MTRIQRTLLILLSIDNEPMDGVLPIAMWDFSWLERRWPGAGYEDWGLALDELLERGYTAVRIDAYPHLIAKDKDASFEIPPHWWFLAWGACGRVVVRPWPDLLKFLELAAERGIGVLLSTWYREDVDRVRMEIDSAERQAEQWCLVLELIERAGLLRTIIGVDLCNEFPGEVWAPFFDPEGESSWDGTTTKALTWARKGIEEVRRQYPSVPLTVSFSGFRDDLADEVSTFDFLEPHIWMSQLVGFEAMLTGKNDRHTPDYLNSLASEGESLYRGHEAEWLAALTNRIEDWASVSRACDRPLVTTESWAVVDARDWPLLDWGWIKEICAFGVETALATGRWSAMCTSNFCGPQFVGMWRDVAWHQRLTGMMKRTPRCASTEF